MCDGGWVLGDEKLDFTLKKASTLVSFLCIILLNVDLFVSNRLRFESAFTFLFCLLFMINIVFKYKTEDKWYFYFTVLFTFFSMVIVCLFPVFWFFLAYQSGSAPFIFYLIYFCIAILFILSRLEIKKYRQKIKN